MIDFACTRCGSPLSVPADLAGIDLQCADCGLLLSVPLPSDLANVNADGTLRMAEAAPPEDPDRLAKLVRFYGSNPVDDDGDPIDNRQDAEVFDLVPPPNTGPAKVARAYDPETGELVRAIEVAKPAPLPALPLEPSASDPGVPQALAYVTPGKTPMPGTGDVWLRMFEPANAVVLVVVTAALFVGGVLHFFIMYMLGVIEAQGGPHIPAWLFNGLFWLAAAHLANVVEETGPNELDELPRPLRQVGLFEDVLFPLLRILVAFGLTYGPGVVVMNLDLGRPGQLAAAALFVAGGLLFPAVLLTLAASHSPENLRPDRVLRVIRAVGPRYWPLAGLSTAAVPVFLFTAALIDLISPVVVETPLAGPVNKAMFQGIIMFPLMLASMYALHGICWRLGQWFRRYGSGFGWAWEEHDLRQQQERARKGVEERRKAEKRRAASRAAADAARAEEEARRQRTAGRRSMAVESLPPRDYV
jgi:hypothetical protein